MPAPHAVKALLVAAAFAFVLPAHAQTQEQTRAQAQAQGGGASLPQVLKGSAIGPAPLARATPEAIRYQVTAGEDLWLVDRDSGDLVACRLLNTSTVNRRIVRCWRGELPRGF